MNIVKAAIRWPPGIALVTWRYLWQTLPVFRVDEPGDARDLPPALPQLTGDDQPLQTGVGPLYHRRFSVRIRDAILTPVELMEIVADDFNRMLPSETATLRFTRKRRPAPGLRRGDRAVIKMPGPWDGPIRVLQRTPTSLRFATLDGHLEAGQIEFSATRTRDGLEFCVEAWARPATALLNMLFTHLRIAKEIQLNMWVRCCRSAAEIAGGEITEGVQVHTRTVPANAVAAREEMQR
ncbi:MAG: DUF1990 family protein [Sporichthyaceae bacterium]